MVVARRSRIKLAKTLAFGIAYPPVICDALHDIVSLKDAWSAAHISLNFIPVASASGKLGISVEATTLVKIPRKLRRFISGFKIDFPGSSKFGTKPSALMRLGPPRKRCSADCALIFFITSGMFPTSVVIVSRAPVYAIDPKNAYRCSD